MTNIEWEQYGDACVTHESTTIGGVEYNELRYVVTYEGREWGYFGPSDLVDMNLTPQSKNVRLDNKGTLDTTSESE